MLETRKDRGNAALGQSIAYFSSIGWIVSIPLADTQKYDIVVDDGSRLLKVQVKSTIALTTKKTGYQVHLCTDGGNRSNGNTTRLFDNMASDILYIVDGDGHQYVIPSKEIDCKYSLTLNAWKAYRV